MVSTVIRNWKVVDLTHDNRVVKRVNGQLHESDDRPSDYWDVEYLTHSERVILHRGLTATGQDRERPRP